MDRVLKSVRDVCKLRAANAALKWKAIAVKSTARAAVEAAAASAAARVEHVRAEAGQTEAELNARIAELTAALADARDNAEESTTETRLRGTLTGRLKDVFQLVKRVRHLEHPLDAAAVLERAYVSTTIDLLPPPLMAGWLRVPSIFGHKLRYVVLLDNLALHFKSEDPGTHPSFVHRTDGCQVSLCDSVITVVREDSKGVWDYSLPTSAAPDAAVPWIAAFERASMFWKVYNDIVGAAYHRNQYLAWTVQRESDPSTRPQYSDPEPVDVAVAVHPKGHHLPAVIAGLQA